MDQSSDTQDTNDGTSPPSQKRQRAKQACERTYTNYENRERACLNHADAKWTWFCVRCLFDTDLGVQRVSLGTSDVFTRKSNGV